ncbi:WD repeat-containing protein WRAP73-like isoform X1 [Liolophura sinensis]|uniref:WD repeat-containing protein WRAP73-like isoform X1 n=1 Tax=Liolophura sinensis TaxID=3198878 RepID=UPI0031595084
MNFSELFKHTGLLCRFSPDGKYLASVVQYRLVIRDVETLQVLNLFSCVDTIQYIEWSVDSQFVLCGMYKRALVQVWSLENPDWTCKIDEGSAGLSEVRWGPDGRHILTTAEFHLRITVWSLLNKTVSYIKYPKQCQKGVDFSTGGKYMALAERRDCKDYVSVFACSTWELVKHFETATEDLAGLEWSPDGRVLAVWESLLQYKILIYSVDGRCLATYSAYDHALGVKSVAWAPTSQFLAIGSYDQKVRILNHITWKTVTEEDHPATIDTNNVIVYKETENRPPVLQGESTPPRSSLFSTHSKYEIEPLPASIPVVKPDPKKANPKMGVGSLSFSCNCQYMISRNDNMPHTLWVWDVQRLSLAVVLVQAAPIKCIDWDPCQPRLALCTGTNKLYMWSPAGCLSVEIPAEASFHIQSVKWHPGGEALLLIGKDEMCVCFLSNSSQETRTEDS